MAKDTKYISETDKFISQLLKDKPELVKTQKELRSTWWDKDFIDPSEQKAYEDNSAPKHGYAYFDYSSDTNAK